MEEFTALSEADDVRTFPNIEMPAPVVKPQKKSSHIDQHKRLFLNTSTGPDNAPRKLPGLLKTRQTKLLKDRPVDSDGRTFSGFNSTHFKLDMNQAPAQAYSNIKEYKTTAKPSKKNRENSSFKPQYVTHDLDAPDDLSPTQVQQFSGFRPQQVQSSNSPKSYKQAQLMSKSMPGRRETGDGYLPTLEDTTSPRAGGAAGTTSSSNDGSNNAKRKGMAVRGQFLQTGGVAGGGNAEKEDGTIKSYSRPNSRTRTRSRSPQRASMGAAMVPVNKTSTSDPKRRATIGTGAAATGGTLGASEDGSVNVVVETAGVADVGTEGDGDSVSAESQAGSLSGIQRTDQTMDELRNYITLMDKYSLHNFMIYEGKALHQTPEFQSFKRSYQHKWGAISGLITQLEEYLVKFEVKLALINGPRLFELSKMNLPTVTTADLHSMIQNIDQIELQMETAGEHTQNQTNRLITKVQARVRVFLERLRYKRTQRRLDACILIQSIARRFVYRMHASKLKLRRTTYFDTVWAQNRTKLEEWWREKTEYADADRERLILYIPSVSTQEYLRMEADDFHALQNAHISVLHMLQDPDVTVLYVTPFIMNNSDKSYHEKFLALLGVSVLPKRLYFVTPELINALPHHLTLSSVLWCSPAALNKIRTFIRRFKMALLLPTTVSWVERRLSTFLNIPMFGPDPGVAEILQSRSFSKNVFTEATVNMPLGSHDIFSADDLFIALSRLMACNVGVCRWVIRLNYDLNNSSCVYIDTEKMPLILTLRKEQHEIAEETKNPTTWFTRQIQLSVRKRVINMLKADLVKKIHICRPDIYTSWELYLRLIRQYGAVIEAEPIEKLGTIEGICCVDPLGNIQGFKGIELQYDKNYQFVNYFYPQGLVPMKAVEGATTAIVQHLHYQHRIIGFISIKFVAFWDAFDNIPRMWAVGMHFGQRAVFGALGTAAIATTQPEKPMPLYFMPDIPEDKFCTYIPMAVHAPLRSSHDDVFFKLCRMRGVAFDVQNRVGTLFFLVDSVVSGVLSILCIASTRKKSLELAVYTVGFIVREFGMDTDTNRLRGENMTFMLMHLKKLLKHENREVDTAAATTTK